MRESCPSVTSTNTNTIHDIACPDCGGRLRLLATIAERAAIEKILKHLGLPADLPSPAPPRAPPWLPGVPDELAQHSSTDREWSD